MSDGELTRLEVLRDLDQRRLTVETTAQLLGLERRQVFRLLKAYRSEGATSRLMHLQFVESESTFAYFHATRAYLEAWGKPVAFYSDKHGVFRVNQQGALGGDGMTQFGRALHALNIDIICANSSQAKG